MVLISKATESDFEKIRDIAYKTWPVVYGEIITPEQLDYMLARFYSDEALRENLVHQKHHFIMASDGDNVLGFASFQHHYSGKNTTHLHKIYVLPEAQGKGVGKLLIQAVLDAAQKNHSDILSLNVNRFNKALDFYKKNGFEIVAETDIELEYGYLMEDYIMERKI
jgi:diamine N-acetyltransferase